jgi:hypothetical protein
MNSRFKLFFEESKKWSSEKTLPEERISEENCRNSFWTLQTFASAAFNFALSLSLSSRRVFFLVCNSEIKDFVCALSQCQVWVYTMDNTSTKLQITKRSTNIQFQISSNRFHCPKRKQKIIWVDARQKWRGGRHGYLSERTQRIKKFHAFVKSPR